MLLLGLSGSLRRGSHNRRLLAAAAAELPSEDRFEMFERLHEIPPYNEDLESPEPVVTLRAAIDSADAVLIATPEYNGSVPGQLKNALDWASRPFPDNSMRHKPVAVIGASTGLFGALWAQAELRKVLGLIGARVLERELPVGQAHEAFDSAGRPADEQLRSELADLLAELRAAAFEPAVQSAR
ncbi:hypothetical protein BH20ACT5_BH20ACT5_13380 [soil metagenome]